MLITETEGPGNLQNVCCFIWPTVVQSVSLVITWLCGLVLAVLEHLNKYPEKDKRLKSIVVNYLVDNRQEVATFLFWTLIATGVITFLISLAVKYLQPIEFKSAKRILDRIDAMIFGPNNDDVNRSSERVTLFKIRRLPFGLCGEWAGIICRSGEFSQRSNTIFSIHRNGHDEANTGCIGKSFLAKSNVWREALPVEDKATNIL
ncbi:hypothetical protein [Gimesia panareensis]|uniref:hypothetical protein n=1 Tax=Gimesia panareensis TaxID=2527978 RepID=UPI00118BAF15|nr:hypothetical protein [Gimesia panareensis]QDU52441.1 hypothetical protein Pan110_48190 [Gimesia panareensis]